MVDIAPELYEKIKSDFERSVKNDKTIQEILEKVNNGTATSRDIQIYSIKIGDHAAAALTKNITTDVLPNGRMYYNIAERTLVPQLIENYNLVENIGEEIQKQLNADAGIGLNPVRVEINQSRVDGLVNKMTEAENFDSVSWLLDEPVKNFTQSVADDFVRGNAEFQAKSGLKAKITREVFGNCCDWCENLAGTYDYGSEPAEFYQKHEYCRCLILYKPEKGRVQNSHTKQWFNEEKEARIEQTKANEKKQEERQINGKNYRIAESKSETIRFNSGSEANEYFSRQSADLMDDTQAGSDFNYWSNDGSSSINNILRGNTEAILPQNIEQSNKAIKNMNNYINNQVLDDDIRVYRTLEKSAFEKATENGKYSDKGFTATAATFEAVEGGAPYGNESVWMEITVPKGQGRGAYINSVSEWKDAEFEYLIHSNAEFDITGEYRDNENRRIIQARLVK